MQKDEDKNKIRKFKRIIWAHYKKYGRHDLPWRTTTNPYRIIVSELMLQQTQVARVIEKYSAFLKLFPTVQALANAPLSRVIAAWSGLGYNRRAKYLHQLAREVIQTHNSAFPRTVEELRTLPGIGPYTAGVVAAFAYNQAVPIIETNIRTVYLHHFFSDKSNISDKQLLTDIETTLDKKRPREWYWALMDYGSYLKQQGVIAHRSSAHYKKQNTFLGSRRQVRGAIVRALIASKRNVSALMLTRMIKMKEKDIVPVLLDLEQEGMVEKKGRSYRLAGE